MRSLRARLSLVVLLALIVSVLLGLLSLRAAREEATLRTERVEASLDLGCDRIRSLAGFVASGSPAGTVIPDDASFRRDMRAVLAIELRGLAGVSGGVWRQTDPGGGGETVARWAGSARLAGSWRPASTKPASTKPASTDAAPVETVALLARSAIGSASAVALRAGTVPLLLVACPLGAAFGEAAAWLAADPVLRPEAGVLALPLGLLGGLVLAIVVLLGWTLAAWNRGISRIERALDRDAPAGAPDRDAPAGALPVLAASTERELDRVVIAINAASGRLAVARARAERAERLAFLGSVASGIAHEIRNPVAAMRLRAENALTAAATEARRTRALADSLVQIGRIEALVSELLALASPRRPAPVPTALGDFLASRLAEHADTAAARSVGLVLDATDPTLSVPLDPVLFGRALDNLVGNAVRHARTAVAVAARRDGAGVVRITVRDDGTGIPPALLPRLFQPFATGRTEGVGLGLAIARDIADAHGATIVLAHNGPDGASFEVAWLPS